MAYLTQAQLKQTLDKVAPEKRKEALQRITSQGYQIEGMGAPKPTPIKAADQLKGLIKNLPKTLPKIATKAAVKGTLSGINKLAETSRNSEKIAAKKADAQKIVEGTPSDKAFESIPLVGGLIQQNRLGNQAKEYEAGKTNLTPGIGETLGQTGQGVMKGTLSTAQNLSNMATPHIGVPKAELPQEWTTPTNLPQQIGFGAEQIGEFFLPELAAGKLAGGTKAAGKLGSFLSSEKLVPTALKEAGKAGAVTTVQEGELNPTVAAGSAIAGGFGAIGKAGKLASNALFASAIPSTITQKGISMAEKLGLGEAFAKDVGFRLSKKGMLNKAQKQITKYSNKLDTAIAQVEKASPKKLVGLSNKLGFTADDIIGDEFLEQVISHPLLKLKFGDIQPARKAINQVLTEARASMAGKALKLSDVQLLKKDLGQSLTKFFAKQKDAVGTAKEIANDIIRQNAKNIIERNVSVAKNLNKRMAPLLEGASRLKKKGSYSGYLTDVIAGGQSAGGIEGAFTNPVDYATKFASGILLKRALFSTGAKTGVGSLLRKTGNLQKLAPAVIQGIKQPPILPPPQ